MTKAIQTSRTEHGSGDRTPRSALAIIAVIITLNTVVQRPGLIVQDTRLDLAFEPWAFMGRVWNLWNPSTDMGGLQNQAVGYLFPMGPFFALGNALHLPLWLTQRLWMAALLVVALWGAARLADALRIGTPVTRVVAALVYTLSPFFVVRVGSVSAFVLGAAFLPWAIVPLVRVGPRLSPRRAAALSGLAVLAMGGINAAGTLAALVAPVLFLLTRERSPQRSVLLRWWLLAAALASAWWAIPLAYQARYGINFLPFTERADVTTSVTSPTEVLRGTADWLSYLNFNGPSLVAGYALVIAPLAIVVTTSIAAIGLYGLAHPRVPERQFLVVTFVIAAACVGAGYGGLLGNPASGQVVSLLDGALAPFRNVYKFTPALVLALALGSAHALELAIGPARDPATVRDAGADAASPASGGRARAWRRPAVVVGVLVLVMAGALPLFSGRLVDDAPLTGVPSWWAEAEAYLDTEPARTLVVPGLPSATYRWGYTAQEPIQWGSDRPWATRTLAPLGSPGATAYLDAVEAAIERGGDPALPELLRRGGFSAVLVQNDADWEKVKAPPPSVVDAALRSSGLQPAASFGPLLIENPETGTASSDLRQIEIFHVAGGSPVTSYPASTSALVSGGPGSPLALAAAGLGDRAYILEGDLGPGVPRPPYRVITDDNRRRYYLSGLTRSNTGPVLTPAEAVPDSPDPSLLPDAVNPAYRPTVASRTDVVAVTSADGAGAVGRPDVAPSKAFDGDPRTAWVSSAPRRDPDAAYIELQLASPVDTDHLDIRLLEDGPWRPAVHAVRVTTDQGSALTSVRPDESVQRVAVPRGPTKTVRITLVDVQGDPDTTTGPGIREVQVPGVDGRTTLVVPDVAPDATASAPVYVFDRARTNPASLIRGDEERDLARRFTVPAPMTVDPRARGRAEAGAALLDLIDTGPDFAISASSTLGDQPEFAPRNLVDGDGSSLWVAATTSTSAGTPVHQLAADGFVPASGPQHHDPNPSVQMRWSQVRSLDRISVTTSLDYSSPTEVEIRSGDQVRRAVLAPDGTASFDPIQADHVAITFPRVKTVATTDGRGHTVTRPLGLVDLRFPQLDDLTRSLPGPDTPVHVACPDGPSVTVGTETRRFGVDTTIGAARAMTPVDLTSCPPGPVALAAGSVDLTTAMGTSPFNITTVGLAEPAFWAAPAVPTRPTSPQTWTPTARSVQVGAGAPAILVVSENRNDGWQATLDGAVLTPLTVDGWRQGWVLPEGGGGVVELTFTPTLGYRLGLLVGLGAVLALVALAAWPGRPGTRSNRRHGSSSPEGTPAVPPRTGWGAAVVAVVAGIGVGGVAVVALVPLAWVRRARPGVLPIVAATSLVLAGFVSASDPGPPQHALGGPFGWPATALAVLAFLSVAATLVPWPERRSAPAEPPDAGSRPEPPPDPSSA